MKTLTLVVAAGLGGALIVVACSDDSPVDADAAVCDCPAAEPPITPARLHRVQTSAIAGTNAVASPSATCPPGELLLSGSCYLDVDNTAREVTITFAGQIPSDPTMQATTWRCEIGSVLSRASRSRPTPSLPSTVSAMRFIAA